MSAGRPLEPVGDGRPRWMTATSDTRYRTRRTGRLVRHALVMVLVTAADLTTRTSVLVDGGQHRSAFDGPATAQTAQRRPSGDQQIELATSSVSARTGSRRHLGVCLSPLLRLVVVVGPALSTRRFIARSSPRLLPRHGVLPWVAGRAAVSDAANDLIRCLLPRLDVARTLTEWGLTDRVASSLYRANRLTGWQDQQRSRKPPADPG